MSSISINIFSVSFRDTVELLKLRTHCVVITGKLISKEKAPSQHFIEAIAHIQASCLCNIIVIYYHYLTSHTVLHSTVLHSTVMSLIRKQYSDLNKQRNQLLFEKELIFLCCDSRSRDLES